MKLPSFYSLRLICLSFSLLIILSSCSHTTSRETTSVTREEPATSGEDAQPKTIVIEKTETVTETEETCGGILSCTVDVIGTVIALPFRAVGFLIGVIF